MQHSARTKVGSETWVESREIPFRLSSGKVVKAINIFTSGYFTPTFTGTPVVEPDGIAAGLIESVSFLDDKERVIKSLTPAEIRFMSAYRRGKAPIELYKANATATGDSPSLGTRTTPFALGTTGQNVAFQTGFEIPMEMIFGSQPSRTFYPVGTNVIAKVVVKTRAGTNVQQYAKTDISACTVTATISVGLIESPDTAMINANTKDWELNYNLFRQVKNQALFAGTIQDYSLDIPRNGGLAGIFLSVRDGTNRAYINMDKAEDVIFRLMKNTDQLIAHFTLAELIYENMSRKPLDEYYAGMAYLNLLSNDDLDTALETGNANKLELQVSLPTSLSYGAVVDYSFYDIVARSKA